MLTHRRCQQQINRYSAALLLLSLYSANSTADSAADEGRWAVTGYSAVLTEESIEHVLTGQADYERDFQLFAVALSKQIAATASNYDLEWELQLVKHTNGQNHYELNGLYALRWYPLPWDKYLESSAAIGLGLSYASEIPEFEAAHHDKARRFLPYILLEAEFQPKGWGHWSLVLRSHHRSGAFGLFSDVRGASNSLGLGVKYRF